MVMISRPGRRIAALLLLSFVGCSDPNATVDPLPRAAISGSVTLDGQSLPDGSIQFDPLETGKGTTFSVAAIKDGKYAIERAAGPVPGKYKVSISSQQALKINPNQEPGPTPKAEPEKIPAQFNTKTTLTAEITEEIKPINFELKTR